MQAQTDSPTHGRVLLVDDMPINLKLLAAAIADRYRISVATDGEEALRLAQDAAPDLIVLDVEMPGMNGFEVCRRLRDEPATQHIPIIFLTGRDADADEVHGLQLGAVDYITKPFNQAVIRARLHTHMELKRCRDLLARHAEMDALTGLPNRRRLDRFLGEQWAETGARCDSIACLLLDIDHFKAYNDHYGHLAGDHCLRRIGGVLATARRRQTDLLARYGGEEFICVMPGADLEIAMDQAGRLREAVANEAIEHAASPVREIVSLSIGVAVGRPGQEPIEALIERADQTLYRAKLEGRDRISDRAGDRDTDPGADGATPSSLRDAS